MMRRSLLAIGILAATAGSAVAQADFDWQGVVGEGQTLEIRGVNGGIDVRPTSDSRARVQATRVGRRSDPESVRIEVVEHRGGITICAVYPTPERAERENECRPGGGHNSTNRNDVEVDFRVELPAGVLFSGHTVNGDVDVEGAGADVVAETVNGDVDVQTTGFAEANTVNGDINCYLGATTMAGDVEFETVNGSITIEMPEGLNADVHASTVNGSIDSDFPIMVTGRMNRRTLRGTIGDGGSELRLSTVNGSIRLRRS
jgi:hypothetical protein